MLNGTAYGVILNDRAQLASLDVTLSGPPYFGVPRSPVLYIKPRVCAVASGTPVDLPSDMAEAEAASTIALQFARDATSVVERDALSYIGGTRLAIDISEPNDSFYRPAIRQRCRDSFLPLGALVPFSPDMAEAEISTFIDGRHAHSWSLDRLARGLATLISEISEFMTLRAGDLLMVGLPGDAPRAAAGQTVTIRSARLPSVTVPFVRGAA